MKEINARKDGNKRLSLILEKGRKIIYVDAFNVRLCTFTYLNSFALYL
jgi:hypothetical protein